MKTGGGAQGWRSTASRTTTWRRPIERSAPTKASPTPGASPVTAGPVPGTGDTRAPGGRGHTLRPAPEFIARRHWAALIGRRSYGPPAEDAGRPEGQHEHHDQEGEDDAVGGRIGKPELLGEADQQRTDGGAGNASHAADDHHDEGGHQVARVLARRDRQSRAADDAREAGQAGPDRESDGEDALHGD